MKALTPREASIFACFTDAVVAPEPLLPAVRDTDAVAFFDDWMARSPRLNRLAFRALLYGAEVAPWALGFRQRLRTLPEADRARALAALETARPVQLRHVVKLVKGMATLSYYGDDQILGRLGYDADANLRRARELRSTERRP